MWGAAERTTNVTRFTCLFGLTAALLSQAALLLLRRGADYSKVMGAWHDIESRVPAYCDL